MNIKNLKLRGAELLKKKSVQGCIALAALGGAVSIALAANGPSNYSLNCGNCDLGSPMPTTTTLNAINSNYERNIRKPNMYGFGTFMLPGDTVTVCNGSACVTYTYDSSGNYLGAPPVQQVRNPPRTGGGGSGGTVGGGGGGGFIGGGSGGGASGGTVTVRDPVTVKEK
ncbi:hypothetical protein ACCQ13_09030 [Xanthomonas sp. NCPPB 1638]|uniref:hypothetical protein n=1 Tax=Xanthomonas TaxID=338 RepID=UPI00133150A3|nr:hypothetical protein [Xanthomonas cucurbitae]WDM77040.1 hypothetical protein K6982_08895 [Xanthomonas cucurbitae]